MKHQQETCPYCGYPVLGSEQTVCSECGEPLRISLSRIHQRRWQVMRAENRVLILSTVLLLSMACMFVVLWMGVSAPKAGLCVGTFAAWMIASLYTSFGCYVMPFLFAITYVMLQAAITLSGANTRVVDVYLWSICVPSTIGSAAGALLREWCWRISQRERVGKG